MATIGDHGCSWRSSILIIPCKKHSCYIVIATATLKQRFRIFTTAAFNARSSRRLGTAICVTLRKDYGSCVAKGGCYRITTRYQEMVELTMSDFEAWHAVVQILQAIHER